MTDYTHESLDRKPVQLSEIAGIRLSHLGVYSEHADRVINFNYPDRPVENAEVVVKAAIEEEVLYHPAIEGQRLQLNGGTQLAKDLAKSSEELKKMFGMN